METLFSVVGPNKPIVAQIRPHSLNSCGHFLLSVTISEGHFRKFRRSGEAYELGVKVITSSCDAFHSCTCICVISELSLGVALGAWGWADCGVDLFNSTVDKKFLGV